MAFGYNEVVKHLIKSQIGGRDEGGAGMEGEQVTSSFFTLLPVPGPAPSPL